MSDEKPNNDDKSGDNGAGPTRSFDSSVTGPGSQIGPFRIERELGRGGAGVVYLAHDTKLNRPVAIKSLPPEIKDNPKALTRFTREARVLASLNHPNIAAIYEELEEVEGRSYLILEYVPGQTLAERIAKKPLKLEEGLTIALQIAEAVAAAHEHDVIHRDLKPGNIKVTQEGKVKVLDFGLAKVVGGEATDQQSTITEPGRVIGTPAYMSPEQARGKPTDKRSDIWSFGCVLYEMLTATVPFKGETISDTLANILQTEPNWEAVPDTIPANILVLLRRCLEKEPRRRLRDIGDIAITLEETMHTGPTVLTGPRPVRTPKRRYSRISRFWPVAAGVLLGFIVAGIGFLLPATPRVTPDQIRSLAVLPFEASSSEPNLSQFAMWIPDDISVALQKLKVFDRVPAWSLAKTLADSSPIQASRQLNVQGLVQGRIRIESGEISINLELIDGRSSTQVWADTFQTEDRDIEGLKRRMVLTLMRDGLRRTLTADERARLGTPKKINTEAYATYRRGLESMFTMTREGLAEAIAEFERAQQLDPQFIDPLALLADLEWWQTWMTKTPMTHREGIDRAKARLAMALRQAPNNGAVLWTQGILAMHGDWNWKLAKASFRNAIATDPYTADYYEGVALYASRVEGRYADAIDYIAWGLELHPDNPPVLNIEPIIYQDHGFYERALELHKSCRARNPTHRLHLASIALCHAELGQFKEALEAARKAIDVSNELPYTLSSLACVCAQSGDLAGARSILKRMEEQAQTVYVSPYCFAQVYAWLGEWDDAFHWLGLGCEQGAVMEYLELRSHRNLVLMGDQPRYWDIVDRMKFPALPIEHPFHEKEQQMRFGKMSAKPVEATQAPIEKIAVLPFTSISSEAGEEWFVDGITVTLTTQLGRIKALTVISSRSAMGLKGTSKPVREIAQELGVDGLIEGTVIRVGNNVQITAELIDGRRDEQIWADNFLGTFDDILALQSEVTLGIAKKIEVALTPEEKSRFTDTKPINPEAYEAFLKGKFFLDKFTKEDFKTAVDYLQEAIKLDPNYAEAHAGLSSAYWVPSVWGYSRPGESFHKARSAASKAMALDKTLAAAHGSVGWIALAYDWQWQKAKESFERAIELNPNDPDAYEGFSWYFVVAGRLDKAMEMIQTAVKLDPLSRAYSNCVAWRYLALGQVEQAIEQHKKTLELDPGYVDAFYGLAEVYLRMSKYSEAIDTIERSIALAGRKPHLVTMLGRAYALSGKKDEAETLLRELKERATSEYVLPTYFAELYASLGNTDEAFRWLEKGYQERNWGMMFLRIYPWWDPLRSDPRFDDLVQQMKFPE